MLTAACVFFAALQAFRMWQLSKGVISYPLMIAVYTGYAAIEAALALRDPEQWAVGFFVLLNLWAIVMANKGRIRIKEGSAAAFLALSRERMEADELRSRIAVLESELGSWICGSKS